MRTVFERWSVNLPLVGSNGQPLDELTKLPCELGLARGPDQVQQDRQLHRVRGELGDVRGSGALAEHSPSIRSKVRRFDPSTCCAAAHRRRFRFFVASSS